MLRCLNTATLGIRQFQSSLDVLANNLSNINTVAYKGSRTDFVESLASVLRAPTPDAGTVSGTSGVTLGNGVTTAAIRANFTQGSVNQTGQAIENVLIIMAAYLTVSLSISAFMNWYNKRISLRER